MQNRTLAVLFIFLQFLAVNAHANQNFFEQRYRGWFWFENKEKASADSPRNQNNQASDITPLEAKEEIEQFAKELEELKFMMLARPSPENVKAYRDKV